MQTYNDYLEQHGEYGEVTQITYPILSASGLPSAKIGEIVMFETGDIGQILFLDEGSVTVILFSAIKAKIGTRLTKTGASLSVPVGEELLKTIINPLGVPFSTKDLKFVPRTKETRSVDTAP